MFDLGDANSMACASADNTLAQRRKRRKAKKEDTKAKDIVGNRGQDSVCILAFCILFIAQGENSKCNYELMK